MKSKQCPWRRSPTCGCFFLYTEIAEAVPELAEKLSSAFSGVAKQGSKVLAFVRLNNT